MLSDLKLKTEYLPHTEEPPELFFRRAIAGSSFYRRAAGFFSSAVFNLFALEFLEFAKKGGKIELVCSNQLAIEDLEVLKSTEGAIDVDTNLNSQITRLENSSDDALAFFATLINQNILSIKIAQHSTGGLFHDKTGCFFDLNNNSVTFRGSSNETYSGWSRFGNFETLEVFCSWQEKDSDRVNNHIMYLENLWENKQPELEVLPLSRIPFDRIIKKARDNIDDFKPVLEKISSDEKYKGKNTIFPKRVLIGFQSQTIENWKSSGFRGIVKHATGSGKTVTAIAAIEEHIRSGDPAIVVVPSILLLRQWQEEIVKDIPDARIQLCGDGNTSWKKVGRLRNLLSPVKGRHGHVVLTTLDTLVSDLFVSRLGNLAPILLVADETHTLGEKQARKILKLNFGKRLGLSATPERHRDMEGTEALFDFFGGILDPVVTIEDAIIKGRLVNYMYYPIPVELDEDEVVQWGKLTKQIIQLGYKGPKNTPNENLSKINRLFQRRSSIAKKASNKISVAVTTIRKSYKKGEYWLVYCEDSEQLELVNNSLKQSGHNSHIYKSDMGASKDDELRDYVQNGGIMLSIRCLDEGVDIPKISHAVILASSQNPRQFIQRRGRVLRHDGVKEKAVIFDLFTTPNKESGILQDSLLRSELRRAMEFSNSALNKIGALAKIRGILLDLDWQPLSEDED